MDIHPVFEPQWLSLSDLQLMFGYHLGVGSEATAFDSHTLLLCLKTGSF